jgi:hypothetical protein
MSYPAASGTASTRHLGSVLSQLYILALIGSESEPEGDDTRYRGWYTKRQFSGT